MTKEQKKRLVLTFPHDLLDQPITYHLIKDYDLMVNILKARVNPNEEGLMVIELTGKKADMDKGIKYLADLGVNMQALSQDVKWNKTKCVHCTTCIAICPTGAFELDKETMKISFIEDKCIACELCVRVCPYHAMEISFNETEKV